jgi:hypothetical protein
VLHLHSAVFQNSIPMMNLLVLWHFDNGPCDRFVLITSEWSVFCKKYLCILLVKRTNKRTRVYKLTRARAHTLGDLGPLFSKKFKVIAWINFTGQQLVFYEIRKFIKLFKKPHLGLWTSWINWLEEETQEGKIRMFSLCWERMKSVGVKRWRKKVEDISMGYHSEGATG